MGYYDLTAEERKNIYNKMETEITMAFKSNRVSVLFKYFSDADTYIRRNCALITGALAKWENKDLVQNALAEIVKTHISYQKFSDISPADAEKMIPQTFPDYCGGKQKTCGRRAFFAEFLFKRAAL